MQSRPPGTLARCVWFETRAEVSATGGRPRAVRRGAGVRGKGSRTRPILPTSAESGLLLTDERGKCVHIRLASSPLMPSLLQ